MRHKTLLHWLVTASISVLVLGCRSSSGRLHYPEDPLLTRKSPIAGKADNPESVLLAHAEPAMPELPAEVLAARTPPARMPLAEHPALVPATPTGRESSPAPDSARKGSVEALPAVRQKSPPRQ